MIVPVVALVFGSAMVALSVSANLRFRNEARLPMQWSWSGTVNWSAPRVPALMFTPALAIFVLILFVAGAMNFDPRPGQEGMVLPALIGVGCIFVAVHVFHLWLSEKSLRRNGR